MLVRSLVGGRACRLYTTRAAAVSSTQHVLYLGSVLGYVSPERLVKFPRSWLDSVGMSSDVDRGLRWTRVHASTFHTLMAYTLVDYAPRRARYTTEDISLPNQHRDESTTTTTTTTMAGARGTTVDLDASDASQRGEGGVLPSKVFGVGRNTHAQLGLGFASQEATRGMMSGTITGAHGITHLVSGGNGFSLVVTRDTASSSIVYGIGNDTLGALGLDPTTAAAADGHDPWDVLGQTQDPQLVLHPLPKPVDLAQTESADSQWSVESIAAGMDHSLVLLLQARSGDQRLLSTGLNTDGQLGLSTNPDALPIQPLVTKTFTHVPLPRVAAARITQVVCGADSSFALTAESDVWAWGNSEYGQCLGGIHGRVLQPTLVPNPLLEAYKRYKLDSSNPPRIHKLVAGGSFTAILDTNGRVWLAGYGPIPANPAQIHDKLYLVETYGEGSSDGSYKAVDLFCGLEYVVVVTQEGDALPVIWMWGVPPPSVSTLPIRTPTRIPYTLPSAELGSPPGKVCVQDMACNKDHLIVLLSDTPPRSDDSPTKQVWAECVPSTNLTT